MFSFLRKLEQTVRPKARILAFAGLFNLLLCACHSIFAETSLPEKPNLEVENRGSSPVDLFCKGHSIDGQSGHALQLAQEYHILADKFLNMDGAITLQPVSGRDNIYAAPPFINTETSPEPFLFQGDIILKTNFSGEIFDDQHHPLEGVSVRAHSLNPDIPFTAETRSTKGHYSFPNAPAGCLVEIIASKIGFSARKQIALLKINDINRYDFGNDGSNSAFSAPYYAISDKPEVTAAAWLRDSLSRAKGLTLSFSEAMDRASVEKNIALYSQKYSNTPPETLFMGPEQFHFVWTEDDRVVQIKLPADFSLDSDLSPYSWSLNANDGKILDQTGTPRNSHYFKLSEGDFEDQLLSKQIQTNLPITEPPSPIPKPLPIPTPSPLATPSPLPPPQNARESFYFSYDGSASTAGVERVKQALNANQLPQQEWARPWEFLNYENFDHLNQESTGLFKVSIGLTRNPHPNHPLLDSYELGVHVTAPYRCKETRKNLVLTIVADVSNSMTHYAPLADEAGKTPPTRLELLKAGLQQLLTQLKPGDVINLVTFASQSFLEIDGYAFVSNPTPYLQEIKKMKSLGNPQLQTALEHGYRVAEAHYDATKLNRLLLITAALSTEDSQELSPLKALAARRNRQGIYLSAIGMGDEHKQEWLNAITEAGRGAYTNVVSKTDMKEVMGDRFIAMLDLAARNIRFKLEYPGQLYHGEWISEQVSTDPGEVQPTHFFFNTSQYFWKPFKANKTDNLQTQKIKFEIQYTDPESLEHKTETLEKTIAEVLGKDQDNIQAAHNIHLLVALVRKEITTQAAWNAVHGIKF